MGTISGVFGGFIGHSQSVTFDDCSIILHLFKKIKFPEFLIVTQFDAIVR